MKMSFDEPISDVTEGVIKASIKLGIEGIRKLVEKFRDRKIAFVQDKKTIEKVKEDLNSNELKFYKSYIKDETLIIPILMGLTLRKLEEENEFDRISKLKYRIFNQFDTEGIHISQAVQSGIVSRYITYLMEMHSSELLMEKELLNFLRNIENHIYFVKYDSNILKDKEVILLRLTINSPKVFVVSGLGSATSNTELLIQEIDKESLKNYYKEDYSRKNRRIIFFHKVISN
jgi:hypothetical protein